MNTTTTTGDGRSLKLFRITNKHTGFILGDYRGTDEAHALDEMFRDDGYDGIADAIDSVGVDPDVFDVTEL